jgi:hypothetical protein
MIERADFLILPPFYVGEIFPASIFVRIEVKNGGTEMTSLTGWFLFKKRSRE